MIFTVTLNPAIDYQMNVDSVCDGKTNRSQTESISFGGKGINVSKVLKNLGKESVAMGFCGGFTGDALKSHLCEYGIENAFLDVAGANTRINVKLRDKNGVETEINAEGPEVSENEKGEFCKLLRELVKDGDIVVLSGSAPKSLGKQIYAEFMELLSDKRVEFAVDATGEILLNTLSFKPLFVKPNLDELCAIEGRTLKSDAEIEQAARKLRGMGARNVLVSMGARGALLVDENDRAHFADAHKGKVVATVGAGDSMVAGFVLGYEKGAEYAFALANACGGATAFSEGLAQRDAIEALMRK